MPIWGNFFILFLVLAGLFFAYRLLLWFFPKGNLFHELIHIFPYWIKVFSLPTNNMRVETHSYGDHQRQYMLFCSPKEPAQNKKPIIIYYHGGGWRFGTPRQFKMIGQAFVNQGYHVFLPSYRRTPKYHFKDIREDLSSTLLKIKEILQEKNLEDRKWIAGGMSAGGNLAAHIVFDRKKLQEIGLQQDQFSGIFLIGAPLDLSKMRSSVLLRSYAGRKGSPRFRKANPINLIQEIETIPVICLHGTNDGFVELQNAISFMDKLRKAHQGKIIFQPIANASHLEVGKWVCEDKLPRKTLLEWLDQQQGSELS